MGDRATKSGFSCFIGGFGTDKMSSVEDYPHHQTGKNESPWQFVKSSHKSNLKDHKSFGTTSKAFCQPIKIWRIEFSLGVNFVVE